MNSATKEVAVLNKDFQFLTDQTKRGWYPNISYKNQITGLVRMNWLETILFCVFKIVPKMS